MKLSEVTLEKIHAAGHKSIFMHDDASDSQMRVTAQWELDLVKKNLMKRWGDVDVTLTRAPCKWFDAFVINDEKWQEDHEAYLEAKARACARWGSD